MWRRYLLGNPQFLWLMAREKASQWRQSLLSISLPSVELLGERRREKAIFHAEELSTDLDIRALNVLGVDVHPVAQHDHIFLATADMQPPGAVKIS